MSDQAPRRANTVGKTDGRTAPNPLHMPQREKAGAVTASKFSYQYDWALHEFLELHHRGEASIVFVELHEDVVFSTSDDAEAASFIFCQVKAGGKSGFNKSSLVRRSGKSKNSVLGKMFMSMSAKSIADKVHKLGLVATQGFSLELANRGFSLEEIPFDQLEAGTANAIRDALKDELKSDVELGKLHFREPTLDTRSTRRAVIGLISELITERSPEQKSNTTQIYVVLADELRRKGQVTWDYSDWNQLVERKGLTGARVEALFRQYSSMESTSELLRDFESQAAELGFLTRDVRRLREAARTYVLNTLAGGALVQVQVSDAIRTHLGTLDDALSRESLNLLLDDCPAAVAENFSDSDARVAAYIIEYLRHC